MKKQTIIIEIIKLILLAVLMVVVTINTTKQVWMHDRFQLLSETVDVRCNEGIITLSAFCEYFNGLDRIYNVFAAVYDKDLELLTARNPDMIPGRTVYFEPFKYPAVVALTKINEKGVVAVAFDVILDNGKTKTFNTPVYYRWVENYLVMMATPFILDTINVPNTYIMIFIATVFLLFLSICVPLMILYQNQKKVEKCLQK